ncbi:hypothetical protein GGI43DRAFT_432774 [Trichoderma evansii]
MHTVLDVIHATNCVSQKIAEAHADDVERLELTPKEQAESMIAKSRVLSILKRSIRDVESALNPPKDESEIFDVDVVVETAAMDIVNDTDKAPGDVIREGMNGKDSGLGNQVPSLQKMAEDVGPVFEAFQDVLAKPYLKNYNAMLNSVPIIGLKGDNVMYSQTKSSGITGVEDVWSVFGRIPDDVNINSSKAVHFFPYKGDFCMSVGTAIYRKKHRDERDPEIRLAVDYWPKLYLDTWEKIGDNCLLDPNARSVIPFAAMVGNDIRFHLVVLGQDGRLMSLDSELSSGKNIYSELKNASDEKKTAARALKIQKVAYWNGNVVALDDASNTWNLTIDFGESKFTAADQTAVEPLFELTATDIGPVGVKKDGWIYRRRLENVVDSSDKTVDKKKEKKIGWERWMQQNGVTNLGVASPGVMLNLNALSHSLRDRYRNTQRSIYPVVNKIQSFTISHEMFLKKQLEAAEEYQKNENSAAKQKMAIKEAKKLVTQTKIWASILRNQSGYTHGTVSLMGEELSSVKIQLDQQLTVLKDKLISLQGQIKALTEAKKKMDAAFWGSIGAMLLGIGLGILGAVTGVGVIAFAIVGGALFVGGLVAACYFGSQSAKLSKQIDGLEAEMRGVNQAILDIKSVADKFGDLEKMYGTLSQFWGRMFNAAQNLKDMNEVTALQIGEGILEDTTAIEASLSVVRKMKNGCATYLAVLNRVGIRVPMEDSDDEDDDETADLAGLADTSSELVVDPTFKTIRLFNEQVARANEALANGQFAEYEELLETADLINVYTIQMGMSPEAISQALNTAREKENTEAADIFSDLGNVLRYTCTPWGPAMMAYEAVARDFEVIDGPNGDAKESLDTLLQVGDFSRINPVGRVLETIGQAAQIVSQEPDIVRSLVIDQSHDTNGVATNGVKGEESADLGGFLTDLSRFSTGTLNLAGRGLDLAGQGFNITGQGLSLAGEVLSRDLDLDAAPAQSQNSPQEAADIFDTMAEFARFHPAFAVAGVIGKILPVAPPEAIIPSLLAGVSLLAGIAPFSSEHPSSGMLNGILAKARHSVLEMLDKTLALAAVSEEWMKKIPDVPTTTEEVAQCAVFQGQALISCKMAMENARLANNAFVDFNERANEESNRLKGEITLLGDRISSVRAQYNNEIEQASALQVADFLTLGLNRIGVIQKVEALSRQRDFEVAQLSMEIMRCAQNLQTGSQFMRDSVSWVELCERTSGNLGSIYNTLTAVRYGIKVDAVAFKEMMGIQWDQIRKEAEEVKSLLQPRDGAMDVAAMDVEVADLRANSELVQVALPATPLLQQLRTQAKNSTIVWDNINKLQRITYTDDIVGYLDSVSNRKVTLLDIINDIRGAYIQTAAMHYETVEQISTLALLQSTRANNLALGKTSPHVFLKGTFMSVAMAHKKAARVQALMGATSSELKTRIELVKASINEITKAIADANLDLARRDKAYRNKVTGVIVEGCLKGFATGGLVAAAAFAAYSGVAIASIPALIAAGSVVFDKGNEKPSKAGSDERTKDETDDEDIKDDDNQDDDGGDDTASSEEAVEVAMDKKDTPTKPAKGSKGKDVSVQKRVEAAQDTWTALSGVLRSAKDAASATTVGKALFNKMSLSELSMLVQLVKTAIVVMERTVDAVESLSSPLGDLLSSVSGVADILSDMDARCAQYQIKAGDATAQFSKMDAEIVKEQWAQVAEACEAWLDVFNEQRISPISYSVV